MDWISEHEDDDHAGPISTDAPRRTSHRRFLLILPVLALTLAAGSFGFYLGHTNQNSTHAIAKPGTPTFQFPSGGNGDFGGFSNATTPPTRSQPSKANAAAAKIATSVDPGLVDINTTLSYQQSAAAGTGMVISSNGLVLTNNHVIDGATSISVRDVATGQVYAATVVGYDQSSDVALLQLKNAFGLSTVTTNTKGVTKGESIVGIGNAGGVGGTPSYAAGNVVAKDQSITAGDSENPTGSETLNGMIEINAGIQAGDSGGALVNAKGQVVGMDTAASSSNGPVFNSDSSTTAQAFAIPIGSALAIASSIEQGNSSSTVHIGATAFIGIDVNATSSNQFSGVGNGSPGSTSGVTIAQTVAGGPAATSALSAGDVIVSVNGQSVTTVTSLDNILSTLTPGNSVHIDYTNTNGTRASLELTLGSGPPQ
jgi:S1-C subfamily serine protease